MSSVVSEPEYVMRLKYAVSLRRSRIDGSESARPYIGLEQIESGAGRLLQASPVTGMIPEEAMAESLSTTFEPGDVLFGKLRPYLAKVWVAEFAGRCTTELLVMEPHAVQSGFLRYVCLSRYFVDAVDASTFGSKMPRADWGFIGNMPIPVPEPAKQRAIADFLNQETGRLDALVAAKEQLLGLLTEKRRALITHYVTRGLDPRASLRDSGIPWLGKIPDHWKSQRLKFLVRSIEQGWSPECHNVPASGEEWGVLKAGCCNGGVFNPEENKSLPPYLKTPLELEIKPGDVLMSRASGSIELIGSVAIVPSNVRSRLLLSDKIYRLNLDKEQANKEYLVLMLGSIVGRMQIQHVVSGASGLANNIAQGDIKEFVLTLPPIEEQAEIVSHTRRETAKLNALHEATERTIALLKERRAALIAAAVTGEIAVRESASLELRPVG